MIEPRSAAVPTMAPAFAPPAVGLSVGDLATHQPATPPNTRATKGATGMPSSWNGVVRATVIKANEVSMRVLRFMVVLLFVLSYSQAYCCNLMYARIGYG